MTNEANSNSANVSVQKERIKPCVHGVSRFSLCAICDVVQPLRCPGVFGPFQCEKNEGHLGRCQFDSKHPPALIGPEREFHVCLRQRATKFAQDAWGSRIPREYPSTQDIDALLDFAARELRAAYWPKDEKQREYGSGEENNPTDAAKDGLARIAAFNRGRLNGIRRVKQMLLEMHFGPTLDAVAAKLKLLNAIEQYLSEADAQMPEDAEI